MYAHTYIHIYIIYNLYIDIHIHICVHTHIHTETQRHGPTDIHLDKFHHDLTATEPWKSCLVRGIIPIWS
jgi:hypothetical protein